MILTLFVILFAIFPLTDTDIWWHLACAREWVTTWTPVHTPVVNVHEYFQQVVAAVYALGGPPFLVAFKAVLWGVVFALFARPDLYPEGRSGNPTKNKVIGLVEVATKQSVPICVIFLFIFRYHFELRPVLFSLLFLGAYWNLFPLVFAPADAAKNPPKPRTCKLRLKTVIPAALVLVIQWFWCKCQGLYILGPLFAALVLLTQIWNCCRTGEPLPRKNMALQVAFVLFLFAMPFLHRDGLNLFLYPFGLLDRLLGLSPSAAVFAIEIAENRSPVTLLMAGENAVESALMVMLCVAGICYGVRSIKKSLREPFRPEVLRCRIVLTVTAILALVAERNFVLFIPVLFHVLVNSRKSIFQLLRIRTSHIPHPTSHFLLPIFIVLGLWARSLSAYDFSMVAYQRVPVDAAKWMAAHPHSGRLFNDDRAGGYLAFVNPADSIYIDGRFILKTADFFDRYLEYAKNPMLFLADAEAQNIDRAVFPLRYYARWDTLLAALSRDSQWSLVYRDEYFAVFDKK